MNKIDYNWHKFWFNIKVWDNVDAKNLARNHCSITLFAFQSFCQCQ